MQQSWLEIPSDSDFSIFNIPFGVAEYKNDRFLVSRLGDFVINLKALSKFNFFDKKVIEAFKEKTLNSFIKLGKVKTSSVRQKIIDIFSIDSNLEQNSKREITVLTLLKPQEVTMLLPLDIGDYTDFYSSLEHAYNVGKMFRGTENALMPNWKHLPVAYHGRASSICVSGTNFHRPKGQMNNNQSDTPVFGPTQALDFELEVAYITFDGKVQGESITTNEAEQYIFGMCLFNDWSARDIQRWEYVPLGPFLSKNFISTISPWIVTIEALEPFRTTGPNQTTLLPYLQFEGNKHFDIRLEVLIAPEDSESVLVSQSNYKYLYWNIAQQLAHHTINGCNIKAGDLMASGTISGKKKNEYGSLLEITQMGKRPLVLNKENKRTYLEDGDTVVLKGFGVNKDKRIGFGDCKAKILKALD